MAIGTVYFYHADDAFGKLIQWKTKGPFSHVCVEIRQGLIIEARWPKIVLTDDYGTPAQTYTPQLDAQKLDSALDWLYDKVGNPYSVLDIAANVITFFFPHAPFLYTPIDYDCSHLATVFLLQAGYQFSPTFPTDRRSLSLVSPNDMARQFGLI